MGRHPEHVRAREGERGRHRALGCRGVAVRTRRSVRAVPDLRQRTLALRTAPRSRRRRLPCHVRRPHPRSKDAAVSRKPRPWAALAMVALIGAGCGSNAPSETRTASSATKKVSDQDKAVKLAECIRAHGVPHFPDPNPKGETAFGIDVSPEVWKKATEACKDLTPPGAFSGKRSPKQQSDALRFAECVRENGVKDFPDPANGHPLIDTTHIPSSNRPGGMTILNAATKKCGYILKLAAGGQR